MSHLLTNIDAATIGRVCAVPAIPAYVALCGWLTRKLMRPRKLPAHAIDSSNYAPPRSHVVHVVDFDRSRVSICQDQTIIARCCMQGCAVEVKIGRDIIGLVVGAEMRTEDKKNAPNYPEL